MFDSIERLSAERSARATFGIAVNVEDMLLFAARCVDAATHSSSPANEREAGERRKSFENWFFDSLRRQQQRSRARAPSPVRYCFLSLRQRRGDFSIQQ